MGADASCNKPDPAKVVTRETKIRHICLNKNSTGDLLLRLLSAEELEREIAMDSNKCGQCLPLFQSDTKPPKAQPKPIDIHTLRYEDDCTCLHLASKSGCIDVCRLLIEACLVDINIRNTPGLTPTHLACLHDHYDVVLYFISQRADLNLLDESGKTPLDYCRSPEVQELVRRNTRANGENDVNQLLVDEDYGFFKWNKDATFSSQNPLRNNNEGTKKSMTAPPMQARNSHPSNNSLATTRPNSDSTINFISDGEHPRPSSTTTTTATAKSSSLHKNKTSLLLSPRSVTEQGHDSADESKEDGTSITSQEDFFSSPLDGQQCVPSSSVGTNNHGINSSGCMDEIPSSDSGDDVDGLQSDSIVFALTNDHQNQYQTSTTQAPITNNQPTKTTPSKVVQIGNGSVGTNPFYQSFRKEGLAEKLADTRRSGRVVTAKGGSLQRDI